MKRALLKYLLLLPIWLLLFACEKPEAAYPEGAGSLRVAVQLEGFSRAESPGDGSIYDGGGMEDLTLVVVNQNSKVEAIQHLSALSGGDQLVKEVRFEHLNFGNHTIYAYANTERSYLSEAKTLLASLEVGDSFGATQRDALFTTRTGTAAPTTSTTQPLLLTASQEVTIDIGTTTSSLVLVRPIVRFEVIMHNHAAVPVTVTGVTPSAFNPSTGYLLPHGGAIPSSVSYRNLPTYASYTGGTNRVIEANSEGTIYRTELFENRASSYTLDLDLAITTTVKNLVTQNVTTMSANTAYLLRNRLTNRYLVDNNGSMAVVSSISDAISLEHAQWKFSSTSSGHLINVATGNRYYRDTSAANSGSNLSFSKQNNSTYYRISYSSGGTRYLRDNNGSVTFANTNDNARDWQLQTASQSTSTETITHSADGVQLYVVDPVTAAVTPMREQLRNQHVKVVINTYYNEQLGSFRFEATPWTEKNEEVNFN
ncbi:MAG: hypothetical protein IKZ12_02185 [Alistipes sp.]|nr:hypothetical protein [Alistipes sp.]